MNDRLGSLKVDRLGGSGAEADGLLIVVVAVPNVGSDLGDRNVVDKVGPVI